MPIHFKCPTCKRRLSVGSQKAGKSAQCPNCGATIRIPTQEDAAAMKAMLGEESAASGDSTSDADYTQFRFEDETAPLPPDSIPDLNTHPQPPAVIPSAPEPEQDTFDPQFVSLSRRVLYLQGILLATVALLCFLLGYLSGLVGGGGNKNQNSAAEQAAVMVSGRLFYQPKPGQSTPDSGAVLILFPAEATVDEKLPITGLRPEDPPPGEEHQSIRVIQTLGGAYIRTGEAGDYKFAVAGPGKYHVLRLSRHASQAPGDDPAFQDLDAIEKYFTGAEDLIGSRKYTWSTVDVKEGTTLAYDFGVDGG